MRKPTLALLALAICASASPADAFLLLGKSKKVASPATRAVVVREAGQTVIALQSRYVGPADVVALLVPVPKSAKGEPSTGAQAPLDRLDQMSAPRLAEVWEQDPCELQLDRPDAPPEGSESSQAANGAAAGAAWKPQPIDGKTGAEIVAALEKAGFVVPEGALAAFDAHLGAGGGFLLATTDAPESGEEGGTLLPPLRVQYDEADLTLPTRFAAIRGQHDFTAYVLSPDGRFEAALQPNQGVPTNLDVTSATKGNVGAFYGKLVDHVFASRPAALVTEYAWRASTCEACSAPLGESDLLALGSGLLASARDGKQHEVLVEAGEVASQPDGPEDLRQRLGTCYAKALGAKAGLGGEVALDVATGTAGEVSKAAPKGDADPALAACAVEAFKGGKLDKNNASGTVKLKFAPLSRDYFASYILTRLHARYDEAPPGDLKLRRGSPLEGGREEGPDETTAPARAYASATGDNYQPRYVIRHAWPGKIECLTPKRGVWGGKPAGAGADGPSGSAAPSAGPAPRAAAPPAGKKKSEGKRKPKEKSEGKAGEKGAVKAPAALLAFLADGKEPDLASFAIDLPPAPAKPPPPPPKASATPAPPPAPAPAAAPAEPPADGCGCGVPGAASPAGFGAALLALASLWLRRARRS